MKVMNFTNFSHFLKFVTKIIFSGEYSENMLRLMHVKCIYDLCTLPLDIPPYLHHILVIFMDFDDYWE
jgi:hypothetical protein